MRLMSSLSAFGEIGEYSCVSVFTAAYVSSVMDVFFRHSKDVVEKFTVGNVVFLFF